MQFSFGALPLRNREVPSRRLPRFLAAVNLAKSGAGRQNDEPSRSRKLVFNLDDGEEAGLAVEGVRSRLDEDILETFREIDTQNKGRITTGDLERFAVKNGMPTEYVDNFVSAVVATSGGRPGWRWVDFNAFKTYVSSRECALQRTFQLFDSDGDGVISVKDLEVSLAHVRVKCPTSRCVYQSRRGCVQEMLEKVDVDGDKMVDFSEFRRFFMMLPRQGMAVDYWISAECGGRCDVGGCVLVHDEKSKGSPWGHLFAGAMAGAVSRTATAPLETLRLSAMTGAIPAKTGTLAAAMSVVEQEGWKALYKGNLTNVIRSAPQKALDFFAFDAFKGLLGGGDKVSTLQTFAAAGLAGGTSNLILYPLEVVRSRLTVDSKGIYKGTGDALKKIIRSEGVPALYKGVGPSVAAILPEAAIVYGLFDVLKKSYTKVSGKEPGVMQSLSFGVFSAFMGQVVAYPLETVSRRMQVCGATAGAERQSIISVCNEVISEGGPGALYRGIGAASLKVVPMAIVSFGTYELVRLWVNELEDKMDDMQAQQERFVCKKHDV